MGERICPYCGAHLDPAEVCDCKHENSPERWEAEQDCKATTNIALC